MKSLLEPPIVVEVSFESDGTAANWIAIDTVCRLERLSALHKAPCGPQNEIRSARQGGITELPTIQGIDRNGRYPLQRSGSSVLFGKWENRAYPLGKLSHDQ